MLEERWEDVVTRRVFGQDHPPRWVILLSFGQALLLERGKWTRNRLLRFDLAEILGRRDDATLKATAALLHRDSLLPPDGQSHSLLDRLDENSHKHAFAVSEDLKYALRESIELVGNEVVWYMRKVRHDKLFDLDDSLASELAWSACATCTVSSFCSTSRRDRSWATRPCAPTPTARATAWSTCANWRWWS